MPIPEIDGSKVPATESIIPVPLNTPPDGATNKSSAASLIQKEDPNNDTDGISLTTISVVALLVHPLLSVKI